MTGLVARAQRQFFSRPMRYALVICGALGATSLYLLSTATANTALFAERYPTLLLVNGALVLILAALAALQLVRLGRRLRRQEFGSKLALRFVLLLALMSLLPGALIYAVSVRFLNRSIDSWFEVRVDKALESGLNVGRDALESLLKDVMAKADAMGASLSQLAPAEQAGTLNALREQAGVQEVTLFNFRGRILGYAGGERPNLMPEALPQAVLRKVRQLQRYSAVESGAQGGLYLRVALPLESLSLTEESRALQVVHAVPAHLAADAEVVQAGYRDYQGLLLARAALKRLYGATLTFTLLIALLSAFLLAFVLSERLAAPLATLARGTRNVAQGDFSERIPVESRDELGVLTQSFNTMTQQLAQARESAERHEADLARANAYLQSLLSHLSAGVMSFDRDKRLRSANPSAGAILETDPAALFGVDLAQWAQREPALAPVAAAIDAGFRSETAAEWEQQIGVGQAGADKTLLLRGTTLGTATEGGHVVVFDDITQVVQAQRQAAWSEVARRLAHEIKNPLTPIQLSAERLQLKLTHKLDATDADMLDRCTRLIVEQVAALKSMVDAFSQYARSPEPKLQPVDLSQLAREILGLYESIGRIVRLELAQDLPPIMGDPRLLRQVLHNLLQNARDALADASDAHLVVRTEATADMVRLSIEDNGCGFPDHLLKRAFEPYMTTKQKGTGLGLSIVKKIVDDHGGAVTIANIQPHGARVSISFPRGKSMNDPSPTVA